MKPASSFLKALVFCVIILLQLLKTQSAEIGRMVGGHPESIKRVPFLVQINSRVKFLCAGTLVSHDFVVTLASCVIKYRPAVLRVLGGTSELSAYDAGQTAGVSKILYHKTYNSSSLEMDVALLKLDNPLEGPLIKPAPLCSKVSIKRGDKVKFYGWGARQLEGVLSEKLNAVSLKVVNNRKCENEYASTMVITDTMFCAASPGKGSCEGDAGGPALINGEFCGIVSFLDNCVNLNVPGIFVNILKVRHVIEKAMLK